MKLDTDMALTPGKAPLLSDLRVPGFRRPPYAGKGNRPQEWRMRRHLDLGHGHSVFIDTGAPLESGVAVLIEIDGRHEVVPFPPAPGVRVLGRVVVGRPRLS